MKFFLIVLFLLPLYGIATAQNHTADSLLTELNRNTKNDTTRIYILNALRYHISGIDPQKARLYSEEALRISKKINYRKGIADSYRGISYSYYMHTDNDKSMEFAMRALKEYEQCNLSEGISWSYGMIGLSYLLGLNLDKASYFFKQSLELDKKTGNRNGIAKGYNNLGIVEESKKDYKAALQYYQMSLNAWEELGDKPGLTLSYNNIGSIYTYLENYSLAFHYLQKALLLALKTNNKDHLALINQNIGEVYYKNGKYKEGELSLMTSLRIANEIGNKKRKEQTYDVLTKMEEARKNYKAALSYQQSAKVIRDSLYTDDRFKRITEIETRYATEKKEKEIQLLEHHSKIQALWRNWLIVILLFTVIAASIIYFLQRSRTLKAKQLLDTQQLLNKKMQEMDKVKSHFFANISHEFRTPLTLIITPVEEKLLDEGLSQRDIITFQTIRRSANRLLDLINQLLELSKLETGFMKLDRQVGNLHSFVMPILTAFDSLADVNHLKYTKKVNIPSQEVLFDRDKLEKILNNLLSNAFKFSPKSAYIEVRASATEKEKSVTMMVEIRNTGSLIPKEIIDKIFAPFFQGPASTDNGMAGTGLGLSLVKELVKLHNGDINVISDANEGTVFTISIQFEKADIASDHSIINKQEATNFPPFENNSISSETAMSKKLIHNNENHVAVPDDRFNAIRFPEEITKETILIVEDNYDVRTLIKTSLESRYNILEASSRKEGIEVALNQTIDLVVSDVMMPVMDGFDLCNLLKNDHRSSHIPIVLLTAKADLESKLIGLRTGADDYIIKPFNMQEVLTRISNLIDHRKKLILKYQQRIVVMPHEITLTPLDERFIQKVNNLIEDNLNNADFDVEKMAGELAMSRNNILRKLKSIAGLSTSEFIQDFRLRRAAILIQNKTDSISQIAYQVGFSDQSYFSKCFKKKFGKTPSEFADYNYITPHSKPLHG